MVFVMALSPKCYALWDAVVQILQKKKQKIRRRIPARRDKQDTSQGKGRNNWRTKNRTKRDEQVEENGQQRETASGDHEAQDRDSRKLYYISDSEEIECAESEQICSRQQMKYLERLK